MSILQHYYYHRFKYKFFNANLIFYMHILNIILIFNYQLIVINWMCKKLRILQRKLSCQIAEARQKLVPVENSDEI